MVSTDDYVQISNLLGQYCWRVDHGDSDGWAALFTKDGELAGVSPDPIRGVEALKQIPLTFHSGGGGQARHHLGGLWCEYGKDQNLIEARFYNLVCGWNPIGTLQAFASCQATIVKLEGEWKIRRNLIELFAPP
jgi:hypothetical protein